MTPPKPSSTIATTTTTTTAGLLQDLSQEIHRTFNTFKGEMNSTVSSISSFRTNLQSNFRAGGSPAELFFFSWSKFELCELLVKDGYEVRGERHVSQVS